MLVRKQEEGDLEAVFIYDGQDSEKGLISLIAYSTDVAVKLIGPQSLIQIRCKREPENELLEMIAPGLSDDRYLLYSLKKPADTDAEVQI